MKEKRDCNTEDTEIGEEKEKRKKGTVTRSSPSFGGQAETGTQRTQRDSGE